MNIHADHNFLINCIKTAAWQEAVFNAKASDKASLVLSPWHFYEYGNAREHEDTEDLIQFAEALQPKWTMERADLLAFEFWVIWKQLWESSKDDVDPIGTFSEISAILTKVDPKRLVGLTVRDFVAAFSADDALTEIRAAMDSQTRIAAVNQAAYVQGRFTKSIKDLMELKHVALQMARLEIGGSDPAKTYAHAEVILKRQPIATQLECFVLWGFAPQLRCHQTEAALTVETYESGGKLSVNQFVDRQHAAIALPYCEVFVTSDAKLVNRCNRVKAKLPFQTASVLTGEEFISLLSTF